MLDRRVARLATAYEEIARLKTENHTLRERLALAVGQAWDTELLDTRRKARSLHQRVLRSRLSSG